MRAESTPLSPRLQLLAAAGRSVMDAGSCDVFTVPLTGRGLAG